jgi:hypothetical protein
LLAALGGSSPVAPFRISSERVLASRGLRLGSRTTGHALPIALTF